MMATIVGNDGTIAFQGTGAGNATNAKSLINVRNFTCDITADTIETTTMGVKSRTYVRGLASWSGSADVYVDPANLTGGASAISQLITTGGAVGDSVVTFRGNLSASGANNLTGNVIITGFSVNSTMDGLVEGSCSFQGSGPIVFSAS
jgi:hypothetical protein